MGALIIALLPTVYYCVVWREALPFSINININLHQLSLPPNALVNLRFIMEEVWEDPVPTLTTLKNSFTTLIDTVMERVSPCTAYFIGVGATSYISVLFIAWPIFNQVSRLPVVFASLYLNHRFIYV